MFWFTCKENWFIRMVRDTKNVKMGGIDNKIKEYRAYEFCKLYLNKEDDEENFDDGDNSDDKKNSDEIIIIMMVINIILSRQRNWGIVKNKKMNLCNLAFSL